MKIVTNIIYLFILNLNPILQLDVWAIVWILSY